MRERSLTRVGVSLFNRAVKHPAVGVAAVAAAAADDDEWLVIAPYGFSPLPYTEMMRPENVKSSSTMGPAACLEMSQSSPREHPKAIGAVSMMARSMAAT